MVVEMLFWLAGAGVVYTFLGYPVLIGLLARIAPRPVQREDTLPDSAHAPEVCAVVVAYNEEKRIAARIENLLASDYPHEHLRVLVVSDGSTDATVARVEEFGTLRVGVLERAEREGKSACLNEALEVADSEIVVFADARQRFAPDTISKLAASFADPRVGAVSGALEIERSESSVGGGVDAYWRLEKKVRAAEARFDSCIGCTGAVYAIRRTLFELIPNDTILDDVVIPMQIAVAGHRVLFDPAALAFDPQTLEPEAELVRKQRTLAGNFQMLFRYPAWLLPWRNRLWWQLISHKYLRLSAPLLLLAAIALNALLARQPLYRVLWFVQITFYICAGVGMALPRLRFPLFSLPAGFVFLNGMTVRGFIYYLRDAGRRGWENARA